MCLGVPKVHCGPNEVKFWGGCQVTKIFNWTTLKKSIEQNLETESPPLSILRNFHNDILLVFSELSLLG